MIDVTERSTFYRMQTFYIFLQGEYISGNNKDNVEKKHLPFLITKNLKLLLYDVFLSIYSLINIIIYLTLSTFSTLIPFALGMHFWRKDIFIRILEKKANLCLAY